MSTSDWLEGKGTWSVTRNTPLAGWRIRGQQKEYSFGWLEDKGTAVDKEYSFGWLEDKGTPVDKEYSFDWLGGKGAPVDREYSFDWLEGKGAPVPGWRVREQQ